jgi:hypothetical protein
MAFAAGSLVALAGATPVLADGDGGGGGGSGDSHQWSNGTGGHQWNNGGGGGGDGLEQGTGGGGGGQAWNNGGGGGGGGGGQTWNNGGGGGDGGGQTWNNGGGGGDGREPANGNGGGDGNGRGDGAAQGNQPLYQGRVTARGGLALRSAPTRGSQLIRVARQGEIVSIFCKTPGETVDGNPLWYLLTDGTWAWGAARYIDNIGPAPRWC